MKKLIIGILFALALIVKPSYADSESNDPLPSGSKIMLIGDSLGVGLSPRFKLLSKEFKYVPVTNCIVGTNTIQWSYWLPEKIKMHKPDLVLASLGTNDSVFWGKDLAVNLAKLDNLIKNAHDLGVSILWIGIPEMPQKKLPYYLQVSSVIESKADYYFNSSKFKFQRTPDQIHFYPQGYSDWMDSIWDWMLINNIIFNPNEED